MRSRPTAAWLTDIMVNVSSIEREAIMAEAARRDLIRYTRRMYPGYRPAEHQRALAAALESIERGEIRRLIVTMPPRHGKSELVSRRFPAWYLGRNPGRRIIACSYAATLAERFSGAARDQFADPRWPFAARLSPTSASRAAWDIEGERGGYIAAGVGGPITGEGADLLIIDDPVKNSEEADSAIIRDSIWNWYQTTAYTRLEGRGAAIVLLMTRWHEGDLAGRLLAEQRNGGEAWHTIDMAAINAAGEALWPERYDLDTLDTIRRAIGPRAWSALYQQRPAPAEGAMFKREWFEVVPMAPDGLRWVRYWDLAQTTKTTGDYTVGASVAFDPGTGRTYVRDVIRGRWEWPDARALMRSAFIAEPGTVECVERAMHGLTALQEFERDAALLNKRIYGITVDRDKVSRAQTFAARAATGRVRLVQGPWIADWLSEVCAFPQAAHDDQVDSVVGAFNVLARELAVPQGPPKPVTFADRLTKRRAGTMEERAKAAASASAERAHRRYGYG